MSLRITYLHKAQTDIPSEDYQVQKLSVMFNKRDRILSLNISTNLSDNLPESCAHFPLHRAWSLANISNTVTMVILLYSTCSNGSFLTNVIFSRTVKIIRIQNYTGLLD